MFHRSNLLFATFSVIAACSAAEQTSNPGSVDDAGVGNDGGVGTVTDGGATTDTDGSARDAGADATAPRKDGGSDAAQPDAAPQGPFGQTIGTDPCSRAGAPAAPAWVAGQRCNARTGRSTIVSTQSGAVKYTKDLNSGAATTNYASYSTFAADGTMYAQGDFIAALDAATRTTKWSWYGGSIGPVVAPNGNIITTDGSSSPTIAALIPATGKALWSKSFPYYTRQEAAVLPNGNIAFVASNANLVVLDAATGDELSSQALGVGLNAGNLTLDADGIAYVPFSNRIDAIDVATKQVLWTVATKARLPMLDERDRTLYFFSPDTSYSRIGKVSAVDGTGLTLSTYTFPQGSSQSALALGDDGWVYMYANGELHGVNMLTQAHWEGALVGYPSAPVVGGDGTVYLAETGTNVTAAAFSKTGTLLWRKTLGPTTMPSSPGSFLSIAPTGHLHVSAAGANAQVYMLGD